MRNDPMSPFKHQQAKSSKSIESDRKPHLVISSQPGFQRSQFAELYLCKDLLYFLVRREIVSHYRQTALGVIWVILQPLAAMVIFTVFFGLFARFETGGLPYPLFCYPALVVWVYFHRGMNSAAAAVTKNSAILNKIYFPRALLPLAPIVAGLVDLAVSGSLVVLLLFYYRIVPTMHILAMPVFVILAIMAALGSGTLLAALTVRYRDFRQAIPFMTQLWMFLTPTFYPVSMVPERFHLVWALNPMVGVVEGVRWALFGNWANPWMMVAVSAVSAMALLVLGLLYFQLKEESFADFV